MDHRFLFIFLGIFRSVFLVGNGARRFLILIIFADVTRSTALVRGLKDDAVNNAIVVDLVVVYG